MASALGLTRKKEGIVEGEFVFTSKDFEEVRSILYKEAGIAVPDTKATLVYSRLAKRIRQLNLGDFREYLNLVTGSEGRDELDVMIAALTTNLTRFFREPHHFDDLKKNVIEPIADKVRSGGRLRIWSAGCSTGQEPYSIAFTILSVIPNAANLDVRILGTDIDPNVIATGRAGIYTDEHVEPVPANMRGRWIKQDPDNKKKWVVGPEARSIVTLNQLNLMNEFPMKGPFQAVFCRNTVIYFDQPTQERIWKKFDPLMASDARLYIGHSERVVHDGNRFIGDGLTTYRLNPKGTK